MPHAVLNPAGLHDPVPFGYSHTASIPPGTELVLVAGQYGSSTDGASRPPSPSRCGTRSATWVSPLPPTGSTSAMSSSSGRML